MSRRLAPIPSLLLTGAVHHHLIAERAGRGVGLVVEAGDVRETHHVALLVGYGAAAVCPYLAIETVQDLARSGLLDGVTRTQRGGEPDQGARQGPDEDHVQDGRVDGGVLHRARRSSRRSGSDRR